MIPKSAKPHEVAIIMLHEQGKSPKMIAYELHYKKVQPVHKVIRKWKIELVSV